MIVLVYIPDRAYSIVKTIFRMMHPLKLVRSRTNAATRMRVGVAP